MSLKPIISFEVISTFDSRLLIVADTSEWKHLSEETTTMDIVLPGSKRTTTNYFQKGKLNKYNSGNLSFGCVVECEDDLVSLPDGIYKLTLNVCEGNKFSKEAHYLRTVLTEIRIMKFLTGLNLDCNPETSCINQVIHIKLLLEGAKADVLFGNIKSAKAKFDKAVELLDDLEHCSCNNCK